MCESGTHGWNSCKLVVMVVVVRFGFTRVLSTKSWTRAVIMSGSIYSGAAGSVKWYGCEVHPVRGSVRVGLKVSSGSTHPFHVRSNVAKSCQWVLWRGLMSPAAQRHSWKPKSLKGSVTH